MDENEVYAVTKCKYAISVIHIMHIFEVVIISNACIHIRFKINHTYINKSIFKYIFKIKSLAQTSAHAHSYTYAGVNKNQKRVKIHEHKNRLIH